MKAWLDGYPHRPAADHGNRGGTRWSVAVLHFTGGGEARHAIDHLTARDKVYVSAHLVIARDGETTQLVSMHRAAYHAGVSEWFKDREMTGDVNRFSVGIELANCGRVYPDPSVVNGWRFRIGKRYRKYTGEKPVPATLTYDDGQTVQSYWEPYSSEQMDALDELLDDLSPSDLVGHEEIAMPLGRKCDPGPRFPWEQFEHLREYPRRTSLGPRLTAV